MQSPCQDFGGMRRSGPKWHEDCYVQEVGRIEAGSDAPRKAQAKTIMRDQGG